MKKIELTKGYVTVVDNDDFDWLSQWLWRAHTTGSGLYASRTGARFAALEHFGEFARLNFSTPFARMGKSTP